MATEQCELLAFKHADVRLFAGQLDKTLTTELAKSVRLIINTVIVNIIIIIIIIGVVIIVFF
jgi:hypothetical protein